jgi:hypothetical protein
VTARFTIGTALSTSVRIWARNLPRFLVLVTLVYLPLIAWELGYQLGIFRGIYWGYYEFFSELHPVLGAVPGGGFVVHTCAAAAVTHGTLVALAGKPAPIGRGLMTVMRRFFPLIGVALVVWVATSGSMVVLDWLVGSWWRGDSWIGAMLYYILLFSLFYLAVPVAMGERRAVIGSISRGFALARGVRIRVFAIVLVGQAVYAIAYAVAYEAMSYGDSTAVGARLVDLGYYGLIPLGLGSVIASFIAANAAVTYRLLREDKDGPGAEDLGKVFD